MSWPPPNYSVPPGGYQPPSGGYQPPPGGYQPPPGGYRPPSGPQYPQHGNPPPGVGGYSQSYQQQQRPIAGSSAGGYPPPYNPNFSVHGNPPPPHMQPAGPPPGVDPTLWEWFQSVDTNKSGTITAVELREALLNSNWSHFNEETCRLLIGMFDKDRNGTIDIHEFGALWKYVQEWKGCFDRFDKDRSGNISPSELHEALSSFGYRLSINFCQMCTRVFDRVDANSMKFDDFIQCCVMLRSLTESFQRMDHDRDGVIDVSYEQFLEMAIDNTIVN